MFLKDLLVTILSNMSMVPAAILCLGPMKGRLRYGVAGTVWRMILALSLIIGTASFLEVKFYLGVNEAILPALILLFIIYYRSITEPLAKTLAFFSYVCAIMAIFANVANAFDALVNPEAGALHLTTANAFFQFSISLVGTALLYFPIRKYGSRLVQNLEDHRLWNVTTLISFIFLAAGVLIVPQKYETLYTNRVFLAFWILQGMFLLLLLLLAGIFYNIVKWMTKAAKDREKARILEMLESSYIRQRDYIDKTARARHDLKQTVRILNGMAAENDLEGIKAYLGKYTETLPENDMLQYCSDAPVNALLNHYAQTASQNGIDLKLQVSLPRLEKEMDDIELCSVIGNILDNAINACREMEAGNYKYIRFSLSVQNRSNLYIVAVNSFNGRVRIRNGMYSSTKRRGGGIGLSSIQSVVLQRGGTARFYHEGTEFFSDVMMPIGQNGNG